MFEKVNPSHPDKVADRIAGALVDLAYSRAENPRIAVEVLIGHGVCTIIAETSVNIPRVDVVAAVQRIVPAQVEVYYTEVPQDEHLSGNQRGAIRCGDNGIFKGVPVTNEQRNLSRAVQCMWNGCFGNCFTTDGKMVVADNKIIICQSNATKDEIIDHWRKAYTGDYELVVNPLGDWTGGIGVDAGATNRKLGSDMADSVTGGGIHGKDLSKADVSVNIYAWTKAQETGKTVELFCAIGDETIDGKPYAEIVEIARDYIKSVGGFEKFAEWGLVR